MAAMSWLFLATAASFPLRAQTSNPRTQDTAREKALIQRYCVTCHIDRVRTAGLSLEAQIMTTSAAAPRSGKK